MLNFWIGFFALALVLLWWALRVLREYERGVVFQIGRASCRERV